VKEGLVSTVNIARVNRFWRSVGVNEKRAVVKSIIKSHADIIPDYSNNVLAIEIYTQTNPRINSALQEAITVVNDT
ncbi:MAG: putative transposase, partial [Mariniphaga sp.]